MPIKARKYGAVYERIREWMLYDGPEHRPSAPKLTEDDREVFANVQELKSLLLTKAHTYDDAMRVFARTKGMSEPTFNRLYHGLIHIYGDLEEVSRDVEKAQLKAVGWKAMQQCLLNKDYKTFAAIHRNLISLGGHDREQGNEVPLEMLNPGAYVLMISEEDKQLIRNALMSGDGVIDVDSMNKSAAMQVEDIEHEDVTPKKREK